FRLRAEALRWPSWARSRAAARGAPALHYCRRYRSYPMNCSLMHGCPAEPSPEYGELAVRLPSPPMLSGIEPAEDQRGIGAAESEGIGQRHIDPALARLVRNEVDLRLNRRIVEI